jgi:hypothetical protein
MHGCDSLVHVDLTVHPVPVTEITASICEGESYYAGDSVFTESGHYTVVMSSMHGCDSLVHIDLTVHPVPVTEISASICEGESYYAGDSVFTESGHYTVVMSSMHGCDSLVHVNLLVDTALVYYVYDTICPGDTIFSHHDTLSVGNEYMLTELNENGCLETTYYNLSYYPVPSISLGGDTVIKSVTMLDAGSDFAQYRWSTGATTSAIQVDESMGYGKHQIWVRAIHRNGCITGDTIGITIDRRTYIHTQDLHALIDIYPNPASDELFFQVNNGIQQMHIRLISLKGETIGQHIFVTNDGGQTYSIDISDLTEGIYLVKMIAGDRVSTKLIAVAR